MSAVRRLRRPRSLLVVLAAAVTIPVLAVAGTASADDEVSTGDTVVGEFVQVWPEYEDQVEAAEHGDEGPLSYVRTEEGDSVRVDTDDVDDVEVGATVELTVGREVSDTASEELGYEEARAVLETEVLAGPLAEATPPPAPAATPFTHAVTVVMVNPAGGTRDATALADVVAQVNGPVADFWEDESNGAIRLGVAAQHNWINTTATCADPFRLWNEVATRVGFDVGSGTLQDNLLLLYVTGTPDALPGCAYGLAEVGNAASDPGTFSYVRDVKTSLIAHELGHNLGLGHSSALQCSGTGYPAGGCDTVYAYRDYYDVMGASWDQLGSLNVVQSGDLGHLDSRKSFAVGSPTETVTLAPVSQRTGYRAIVLDANPGSFWLEYRPASGRDAWLGTADNWIGLQSGVLLRTPGSGDDTSFLLDGTPSPEAGWDDDLDVALPIGRAVRIDGAVAGASFTVTVQSVSPTGATVLIGSKSAITLKHEALGGDTGVLGAPVGAEQCGFADGGCRRAYQHGEIAYTEKYGAHAIRAPVHAAWAASGGHGSWGFPTSDTTCGLAAGGCSQTFEKAGLTYWSPATALVATSGSIRSYLLSNGGVAGPLGYPTAAATCGTRGCAQAFQGGTVVSRAAGGTFAVRGPIHQLWAAAGGVSGSLGLPTSALLTVTGGTAQAFDGGSVYWSAGTGAHAVSGAIRSAWWATGSITGPFGFPTSDHVGVAGGVKVSFSGGAIYSSAAGGTRALRGRLHDAFVRAGGVTGPLGFPTSGVLTVPGGSAVAFQGGSIYDSPATGAHVVRGAIRSAWWAGGGISGPLGFPTSDYAAVAGGFGVSFQGGSIYHSAATGARTVRGAVRSAWWASGGVTGPFGFPTSDLLTVPGGTAQAFSGGSVYSSPAAGTRALPSRVLTPWWATGGVNGPFGFPTSGVLTVPGGTAVAFQGGSVYDSPGTGARAISGAVRSAWWASGGVTGPLGFPTSALTSVPGGTAQAFSGGSMYSSPAGGTRAVRTEFLTAWWGTGGVTGPMGFPTSDRLTVPGVPRRRSRRGRCTRRPAPRPTPSTAPPAAPGGGPVGSAARWDSPRGTRRSPAPARRRASRAACWWRREAVS